MEEMHETSGLRNAVYGMLATLVLNLGVGIYYAGQLETRVSALERSEVAFQIALDRINDAREKTDIHMTQMDDRQAEAAKKIDAILDIVQRTEQGVMGNGDSGPPPAAPPNGFTHPAQPHTGH
mgnify:FL=1